MYHYGDIIYGLILTDRSLCDIITFMKTKPYSETQLHRFMDKIGDAFDYAINDCKIDGIEFVKMFVQVPPVRKLRMVRQAISPARVE